MRARSWFTGWLRTAGPINSWIHRLLSVYLLLWFFLVMKGHVMLCVDCLSLLIRPRVDNTNTDSFPEWKCELVEYNVTFFRLNYILTAGRKSCFLHQRLLPQCFYYVNNSLITSLEPEAAGGRLSLCCWLGWRMSVQLSWVLYTAFFHKSFIF